MPDPEPDQPQPEHHEGTLDLSGEGNEPQQGDQS